MSKTAAMRHRKGNGATHMPCPVEDFVAGIVVGLVADGGVPIAALEAAIRSARVVLNANNATASEAEGGTR